MKKEHLWRAGIYTLGTVVLAFAACLGTKTGLGVSPINATPFALNGAFGIAFSAATFLFYCFMILLQFLIRGKHRRWRDLLQLPFSLVFSALLGLLDGLLRIPEPLWQRIAYLVISIVLLGLGVALTVNMRIAHNPADGLADAIGWAIRRDMGLGKNILDACCVAMAFLIDLCFGALWHSIGIGTVISAIFIGRAVYLFNRLLRTRILTLAGLENEI